MANSSYSFFCHATFSRGTKSMYTELKYNHFRGWVLSTVEKEREETEERYRTNKAEEWGEKALQRKRPGCFAQIETEGRVSSSLLKGSQRIHKKAGKRTLRDAQLVTPHVSSKGSNLCDIISQSPFPSVNSPRILPLPISSSGVLENQRGALDTTGPTTAVLKDTAQTTLNDVISQEREILPFHLPGTGLSKAE